MADRGFDNWPVNTGIAPTRKFSFIATSGLPSHARMSTRMLMACGRGHCDDEAMVDSKWKSAAGSYALLSLFSLPLCEMPKDTVAYHSMTILFIQ